MPRKAALRVLRKPAVAPRALADTVGPAGGTPMLMASELVPGALNAPCETSMPGGRGGSPVMHVPGPAKLQAMAKRVASSGGVIDVGRGKRRLGGGGHVDRDKLGKEVSEGLASGGRRGHRRRVGEGGIAGSAVQVESVVDGVGNGLGGVVEGG
ncbi:hypothetical protein OsI_25791 [Oryza sativa Indica Group]|uniref:Uncharacterized protein n=1 Tax=Oryza sativa subsp. indica TaxID=39946 RepID=A2YKP5_ORYSI|nr:hypothetical protein OsI_25791 [Oryza sativa Indica Group]